MVRGVYTSFLELAPGISEGREGRTTAFLAGLFGPPYLRPQSKHKDPAKQELMWAKVVKVRRLGYIKAGRTRLSFSGLSDPKTNLPSVLCSPTVAPSLLPDPVVWVASTLVQVPK